MDYSYYSTPGQTFQYGALQVGNQVQGTFTDLQDNRLSTSDVELFRGLNSIGSSFDAFSQFSPVNHLAAPARQSIGPFPQRSTSNQANAQPLQPPKSLSPDSNHDEPTSTFDGDVSQSRKSSALEIHAVEMGPGAGQEQNGRSSNEEEDFNSLPAQDRRKAQNRAAQRAFRERKEKHVKELELKLASMADVSKKMETDNERLKRELAALSTENEILRATHSTPRPVASANPPFNPPEFHAPSVPHPQTPGPQSFSPTEFVVATGGEAQWPLKFEAYPNQRGRMLLAGAAWDLIVRDSRVSEGKVDLEEVCRRLKGKAMCDGRGPAFKEDEVRQILDECALGNDDLL